MALYIASQEALISNATKQQASKGGRQNFGECMHSYPAESSVSIFCKEECNQLSMREVVNLGGKVTNIY